MLITGGSSGIGLAVARLMSGEGARIVITGRNAERVGRAVNDLRQEGGAVIGVGADVSSTDGRNAMLSKTLDALGGLDVLVNNAGAVRAGRLERITDDEIRTMIEVDLIAPILLTQAAIPYLHESGEALIVNVSSGMALVGAPFCATYAGVKAGLSRFSESLRRELKGEGIHVLTLYPGATDTPMMQSSKAGPELGFPREPPSAVAEALIAGIKANSLEVVRGGEAREKMIATNRDNPLALDERFLAIKSSLEEAVCIVKAVA